MILKPLFLSLFLIFVEPLLAPQGALYFTQPSDPPIHNAKSVSDVLLLITYWQRKMLKEE